MEALENPSLTEWQVRIRDATTPCELLDIAEELRLRSEVARRELLAKCLGAGEAAEGDVHDA